MFWKSTGVHNCICEQYRMSLARLYQGWYKVFYAFCSQTCSVWPLIITKAGHLQGVSDVWKYPQRFPFTFQTHELIAVIQTETFPRHRLSTNKQTVRRQREKGRKIISCPSGRRLPLYPLCHFFLICKDGQNLPLLSLWEMCFTEVPGDTFSLCLSRFSALTPVFAAAAFFQKLYELVTTLFFLSSPPLLLSHLSLGANSTPASRQTVHLAVHPSVQLYLSGPKALWGRKKKTVWDEIGKKKMI